jgi:hypothetical protein
MPTYSFEHIKTGDTMTTFCTWEESQEVIKDGRYRMLVSAPAIVSGTGSTTGKIDNGFNDVLTRVKKANRGSTIQTK